MEFQLNICGHIILTGEIDFCLMTVFDIFVYVDFIATGSLQDKGLPSKY